ncbi:hypothetical protein TanjilG_33026 [Lupinus angustifolius]|uniref:3'-5' exonuclease n=1 Tax=Lupinus angustifolius TaxID=3871 RepID=A0A4P1RNU6_LUPAN|nr:PREDICTED: Werner Syndrome-like exonuclease [Lupinus angustifolius]OIW14684.1 hypothetical protein TanjilG_33026 [Lupinus angustifolius]
MQEEGEKGLKRLSSFVIEQEPFSDQDLLLIQSIESTFLSNNNNNNTRKGVARRRLPPSLVALQHPNASSSSLKPFPYSSMRLPPFKFNGRIIYSTTFHDVQKATTHIFNTLQHIKTQIALGLDIEWKPTFKKGVPPGKVAVMQICFSNTHCHVLHLFHSGIPPNLRLLLQDPLFLKVGAGIGGDAHKFFRDYDISIKGVEDLSFHANRKLGGAPRNWGLASLTEKLLSKQLKKPSKIRLGNWETPTLSKEQLEYAATDAFASWYLYQAIKDLPDAEKITDRPSKVEGVLQQ